MTTRNSDINLTIRAKTEGEKAIASLAEAIHHLVTNAGSGTQDVAQLGRAIGTLDKAAAALVGAQDKVEASSRKQAQGIHTASAAIAEQQERIATLKRGLEPLAAEADKAFIGPRRNGLADMVKLVKSELADAERQLRQQTASYDRNLTGLRNSRSALLDLRRTTTEVADAQLAASTAVDKHNQSLRDQAALAQQASAVQPRINALTGVNRPAATDGGATFDALIAREAEIARREAEAVRNVKERINATTGVTGTRATDAGASFDALSRKAAHDEEAESVRKAAVAYERFEARCREGAKAMREAASAAERDANDVQHLRTVLDPMAAIQANYNTQLARYRDLAAAGKITTEELAAAETHLAAQAQRSREALNHGRLGLFGLRPYELTNLSYQINDVVTGLASGQHLGQVVAQQGGQILQLFPRVGGAVVGALSNPLILAGVATFTALALGISRAADEAERLRDISADLKLSADGNLYSPEGLNESAKNLRNYGATIEDSTAALKTFADAGISPDRLDAFGKSALDLADTTGIKLPDAAKKMATGFSGGYEAIAKLDDELNFLTATQRESIKQAFEDGNAQEARAQAFAIFSEKVSQAAEIQRGPATEASRSMKKAYNDLLDSLAQTSVVQGSIDLFTKLAQAISHATGNATAYTNVADRAARMAQLDKQIEGSYQYLNNPLMRFLPDARRAVEEQIRTAESELAQLKQQQDRETGSAATSQADTIAQNREATRKADLALADARDRLLVQGQRALSNEQGITTEAEKQLRLRVAERTARAQIESSNPNASDAAKNAYVATALANERAAMAREATQQAKRLQAEREQQIKQFTSRVVGAEGGTANNPYSSAAGYGQFTKGTWLEQFGKVYPGSTMGRDQILALRQNQKVASAIIDNYARENARFLESFGAQVTAGNLYLTHFLGAGTAKAVLIAPGSASVDQVIRRSDPKGAAQVLSGNQGYLRTDGGKGRYRTASELRTFIAGRVADAGQPEVEAQQALNELIEDSKRKQDSFNESAARANDDRQHALDAMKAEAGLHDTALLAEQRRLSVLDAERELRDRVADANRDLKPGETPVVVSQEQIDKAKELAGALFDAQNARDLLEAKRAEAERPLDTMQEQIELLVQQRDLLVSMGEFKSAGAVQQQIDDLGDTVADAYDKVIAFYKALSPEDQVRLGIFDTAQLDNLIKKLEQAKHASVALNGSFLDGTVTYRGFLDAFASSAADAFTGFLRDVGAGENVFKSFGKAILSFAASFAGALAQMIIKCLAFTAALYALSAITGIPVQVLAAGASVGASVHHTGGIAGGAGGTKRSVASMLSSAAMRYHTGGIAGLAPDEVPAILRVGEEVLTQGDPRHRANGGLGSGGADGAGGNVTVIQVTDPAQALEQALRTPAGEKVFINHVRENQGAFKAALGG